MLDVFNLWIVECLWVFGYVAASKYFLYSLNVMFLRRWYVKPKNAKTLSCNLWRSMQPSIDFEHKIVIYLNKNNLNCSRIQHGWGCEPIGWACGGSTPTYQLDNINPTPWVRRQEEFLTPPSHRPIVLRATSSDLSGTIVIGGVKFSDTHHTSWYIYSSRC